MTAGVDGSAYSEQTSMFDAILAALSRTEDVGELFQQLSAVFCQIVPYDEARFIVLGEDGSRCAYATAPDSRSEEIADDGAGAMLDDVEPQLLDIVPGRDRGLSCGLKVPVKIDDRVVGALALFSRSLQAYSASNLLHARRLANFLGHGLAYQRSAEQARHAALERQRSSEFETSLELLRTISDVLDIRTVFPRVSEIAKGPSGNNYMN